MGSANAHVFSKPIFSDFADIHVLNSNTGMADTDIQFGNSNISVSLSAINCHNQYLFCTTFGSACNGHSRKIDTSTKLQMQACHHMIFYCSPYFYHISLFKSSLIIFLKVYSCRIIPPPPARPIRVGKSLKDKMLTVKQVTRGGQFYLLMHMGIKYIPFGRK